VFGLGFSKMITLGLVPAMLALPYRIRETGRGFAWLVRTGVQRASNPRRRGRAVPDAQPAE
jgi:multidrug efflux pump